MLTFSKNQKILFIIFLAIFIIGLGLFYFSGSFKKCSPEPQNCWDGSKVYRQGKKCNFPSCPARKKSAPMQTFSIEQDLKTTCKSNKDCSLPADYALKSNCPYKMACIDESCVVICPKTIEINKDMINKFKDYEKSVLEKEVK